MALNATIHRCSLQVSDLDRGYYQTHSLTLARHPSETEERMMVRLLAFALHADEHLAFTRGLSQDDEPDRWQHGLGGEIALGIVVGQPAEKRIRKACARAERVVVYSFQHRASTVWWQQIAPKLERFGHLSVMRLPDGISAQLAAWSSRQMELSCTVQDGDIWLANPSASLDFTLERLR